MFFRIIMVCLALAACYAGYEIYKVHNFYSTLQTPPADFMVVSEGNDSGVTIVEFMNYECLYCKDTHIVLLDYAKNNPETRLVVRPVPYETGGAAVAAEYALAAGLQGKFADMDRAFAEYKFSMEGAPAEKFYRETVAVYDVDFDRMLREGQEAKVAKMMNENAEASLRSGLRSTPAFMIGKTLYELDKPLTLSDLTRMVQAEKNK